LDGTPEVGTGAGDHPGQDERVGGQPAVRPASVRDRELGRDGKRGMENALRAKPEDVREQYERQLKELQEAYGEAMLELRARKKLASLLGKDET